ncbi:MAG: PP2C family protein-serine/threonine phosphatase [Eubacterium sp.]|nr:PP2C family protein-serine/threonine phosphatase [Eubacterium sp.]
MAKTKRRKFSFGLKMYLFVVLTVLVVGVGAALISYFINANHIDDYFKGLTLESARNVASFVDGDYLEQLRTAVEAEDYQSLREKAEEAEDEAPVEEYLKQKGLWDEYVKQREFLMQYVENVTDIKYLYIVVWGSKNSTHDMYLVDADKEVGIYETGYYEEREESFRGMDGLEEIEPTISTGDWGWLCSGFVPVKNSAGDVVCQVGCDVGMDDIAAQRQTFLFYVIIGVVAVILVVLIIAMVFARRVVVNPLNWITYSMENFKPAPGVTYEEAGVIDLKIKSRDEIFDLYQGVQTMQTDILYQLNDLAAMRTEKERRDAAFAIASQMQEDLLPKEFTTWDEISMYAMVAPAKEAGGGFYDFFAIDDDHVGIVLADVSGTGVSTAMFMIIAKTILKIRTLAPGTPAEMLQDVNRVLREENPSDLSVRAWFAIITLSTGEFIGANAGQRYPVIMRRGADYTLYARDEGLPLAVEDSVEYNNETTTLRPGDRLFLYTGGVPDARNSIGERFGMTRVIDTLNRNKTASPKNLLLYMANEIEEFAEGKDPFDDLTMMSIVWRGKEGA